MNLSKFLLSSLAVGALTALSGPALALTQDEISNYTKPDRQQMLEAGAKQEGALFWYCTMRTDEGCKPITADFMKKYPFIKADFLGVSSEVILQRALAEGRANKVSGDVMLASVADDLKGTNIAAKFTSPEAAAYDPQMIDKEGMWASVRSTWNGFVWNTNRIKEPPTTWESLLDPKYKNLMFWPSISTGAPREITHFRAMWGEEKALDFVKKLRAQNIQSAPGDAGTWSPAVVSGEYPIMIAMPVHQIVPFKSKGAPIDGQNPDPALARNSAMALIKNAPHPHAAMLFVDYILSEQGQKAIAASGYNPTRKGVSPSPDNAFFQPNLQGKKEILLSTPEENDMYKKSLEMYQEYFR